MTSACCLQSTRITCFLSWIDAAERCICLREVPSSLFLFIGGEAFWNVGGWGGGLTEQEAQQEAQHIHTYIYSTKMGFGRSLLLQNFFERSIWLVSQRNKDHLYSHTVFPFMSQLVQKSNSSLASRTYARRNGLKPSTSCRLFPQGIHFLKDHDKYHDNYVLSYFWHRNLAGLRPPKPLLRYLCYCLQNHTVFKSARLFHHTFIPHRPYI